MGLDISTQDFEGEHGLSRWSMGIVELPGPLSVTSAKRCSGPGPLFGRMKSKESR
jgi:hypothetical protein